MSRLKGEWPVGLGNGADWAAARMRAAGQLIPAETYPGLHNSVRARLAAGLPGNTAPGRLWAASGAQAITAVQGSPPGDVAGRMAVAGLVFEQFADALGVSIDLDGAALLGERAALCSGSYEPESGRTLRGRGRMAETADGWLAVNLPRASDLEALPALTLGEVAEGDVDGFYSWARRVVRKELVERGTVLGLAIAAVPDAPVPASGEAEGKAVLPWNRTGLGRHQDHQPRVVDFSGLWAGPLCTSLLAQLGADVTRVAGTARNDAMSEDDVEFNALLAENVRRISADLSDREVLRELTGDADIIVTSSRIAGLERLGLKPRQGQTWIRITAHGSEGEAANRAGFGDDAGAGAGAVVYRPDGPVFAADAVADPVTGLLAAVAGASAMLSGEAALFDLSLSRSAAWAVGPCTDTDPGVWPSAPPRTRLWSA